MTTFRRMARLLGGVRGRYGLLVVAWLALRVGALAVGLLLQRIFDVLSREASAGLTLWSLIALLGGVEGARQLVQFNLVVSRLEPAVVYRVRALLRDRLLSARLSGAVSRDVVPGEIVTVIGNDVDEVGRFAAAAPVHVARWMFAVVAVVILMRVDPLIAFGILVLMVALAATTRMLYKRFVRHRAESMRSLAEARSSLREALTGVDVIQAAGAEDRVTDHLGRVDQVRRRAAVTERLVAELQQTTIANAVPLGTGFVLLAAANGLKNDTLTVGDIALFGYYLQILTEALGALGLFVVQLQRVVTSLDRITALAPGVLTPVQRGLDASPSGAAAAGSPLRVLEVTALGYQGGEGGGRTLSGISFRVPRSSLTVIVGRVGAGKTSLVRALLGLVPGTGTVQWNGEEVADRSGFLTPPRCAYVPQVPQLFSGTIRENLTLGRNISAAEVEEAIRKAMLAPDLATMPDGAETVVGPRGLRLSGGQAQRVAIARALLSRPEMLVLDDPSSALDGETGGLLWKELRRADLTLIVVSHDPDVLSAADSIVVLRDGVMIDRGRLDELLRRTTEMQLLWQTCLRENGPA